MNEIRNNNGLKGKAFAVIAEEAHSSQSRQIAAKLKSVLTAQQIQEVDEGGVIAIEAVLAAEATERAESVLSEAGVGRTGQRLGPMAPVHQ